MHSLNRHAGERPWPDDIFWWAGTTGSVRLTDVASLQHKYASLLQGDIPA